MAEKFDPHQHEKRYKAWKADGMKMESISKKNSEILIKYLNDMEIGKNISLGSIKGGRSFGRLRNLKGKLQTLFFLYEKSTDKDDITLAVDDEILNLIKAMREGKLKSPRSNKPFTAPGTYFKVFKAFWNWYIRVEKRNGKELSNIAWDVDTRDHKPKFNYFTVDQLKTLCDNSKLFYKTLMMFLFDSGCRAPTELMNIKVSDLEYNQDKKHYTLTIREETSKTFGRKIKLLLCSEVLKEYIESEKLKSKDFLFEKSPQIVNEYLRLTANKLLNIGKKDGKWIKDGLTMYDFRHSSTCYWLVRYKSESALKYRFGWKKSDMIHYYSEFLGMKDTIQEEDLYVDISKTELEKQIQKERDEREILQERLKVQEDMMKEQEGRIRKDMEKQMKVMLNDLLNAGKRKKHVSQ